MDRSWHWAACLSAPAFVLALSPLASAGEPPSDPRCVGVHSLWHPLPDLCLGVIDTDRPHQTDTPHVVPAGHSQFESAVVAVPLGGTLGARPGERGARLVLFENNYKFGLVSRVDIQLAVKHADYELAARRFAPPGPASIRAKLNVVEENGAIPAITLVPGVFVPVAPSQALRAGALVFFGWELPHHFELEVNAGVLSGASPKPPAALVLAAALTHTVIGNFRVFIDAYAMGYDVTLGTGALWAFTRDMQIDLGTYVGVHGDTPVATPFLGFSIRR